MFFFMLSLLFSTLCSEEVKLSLFLFDEIESTTLFEKEAQKAEHPIRIFQGDFAKNPELLVAKLDQMKVDAALFSEELLDKKYESKNIHLLTSNLTALDGRTIDHSWKFAIDEIQVGFFGLNQFSAKCVGNYNFCCIDLFFSSRQKVKDLKEAGVDFIVLLCSLSEKDISSLLQKVEGINVVISKMKSETLPFFEKNTLVYFQDASTRLDLLIEKKQMAQGSKVEFYPTWRKIKQ